MLKTLFVLLIFISGCLQTGGGVNENEKKHIPVPYPEEAKSVDNPIVLNDESLALGKKRYDTYCSICHGPTGRGDQEVTKTFEIEPSNLVSKDVKRRTEGELFWACSNGVNGTKMLAWKDVLSDDERWKITAYIRVLQENS